MHFFPEISPSLVPSSQNDDEAPAVTGQEASIAHRALGRKEVEGSGRRLEDRGRLRDQGRPGQDRGDQGRPGQDRGNQGRPGQDRGDPGRPGQDRGRPGQDQGNRGQEQRRVQTFACWIQDWYFQGCY